MDWGQGKKKSKNRETARNKTKKAFFKKKTAFVRASGKCDAVWCSCV